MRWLDRTIALALLAGTIPLWRMADRFPEAAATFPRVGLAVLAALASAMLAATFLSSEARGTDSETTGDRRGIGRALGAFAAALGGVYLMPHLGFFPAMLAFAAVLMPALGVERRRIYVIAIVALLICIYLFFARLLGVPLTAARLAQA